MYPSFKLGSHPTVEVTGITFDSRKVKPGVAFVAIRGYSQMATERWVIKIGVRSKLQNWGQCKIGVKNWGQA